MIQTLLNSLFIQCVGVQNLNIFISHLLNIKILVHHLKMRISENAFLVHTYMVVRRYRENIKPQ